MLQRSVGKPLEHSITSRVQKEALLAYIKRNRVTMQGLGPESLGAMVAMLQRCPLVDEHKQEVMALLAPPPVAAKPRLPMQKLFPRVLDYFTTDEWGRMAEPTLAEAMDLLISRIVAAGGRNPSEKCVAKLASLLLYVCGLGRLQDSMKLRVRDMFKDELKRRVRSCPAPFPFLIVLPTPAEMQSQQPDLFKAVFGDKTPIVSKVDLAMVTLPPVSCRLNPKKGSTGHNQCIP